MMPPRHSAVGANTPSFGVTGANPPPTQEDIDRVKVERELMVAVLNGPLSEVIICLENVKKMSLDQGIDELDSINFSSSGGATCLHAAAGIGSIEKIEILLEHGSEINKENSAGFTPVMNSIISGHMEAVEYLINKGANLHTRTKRAESALHLAHEYSQPEIANYIESVVN